MHGEVFMYEILGTSNVNNIGIMIPSPIIETFVSSDTLGSEVHHRLSRPYIDEFQVHSSYF